MPYEAKMKSEAFSGRQRVKCVNSMIAGQARPLFTALSAWDLGSGGPDGDLGERLETARKGAELLFLVDIGQYRRISTILESEEGDESGFGVMRPDRSCSEVIREWRQKGI